jgi:hypothetical protein
MKKDRIPATVRNSVWNKYIGISLGKAECYCCKMEPVTRANFHCGHIVSENRGGKITINNLRPICAHCNSSMGTTDMNEFMQKYGFDKLNTDANNDCKVITSTRKYNNEDQYDNIDNIFNILHNLTNTVHGIIKLFDN